MDQQTKDRITMAAKAIGRTVTSWDGNLAILDNGNKLGINNMDAAFIAKALNIEFKREKDDMGSKFVITRGDITNEFHFSDKSSINGIHQFKNLCIFDFAARIGRAMPNLDAQVESVRDLKARSDALTRAMLAVGIDDSDIFMEFPDVLMGMMRKMQDLELRNAALTVLLSEHSTLSTIKDGDTLVCTIPQDAIEAGNYIAGRIRDVLPDTTRCLVLSEGLNVEILPQDKMFELGWMHSSTPAAKWAVAGETDPHGKHYNCERAKLMKGELTDDELANAFYLYDHRNGLLSMMWLGAAKDRIRWLSRKLAEAINTNSERIK